MNKYYSCPVCTWDNDVSSTSAVLQIEKRLNIQFTPSNPKFAREKAVEARERFVSEGSSTCKDGANISTRKEIPQHMPQQLRENGQKKKMLTGFAYKMMHLTSIQMNL